MREGQCGEKPEKRSWLRDIMKRKTEVNRRTYVTLIDPEKAFDKVDWKLPF